MHEHGDGHRLVEVLPRHRPPGRPRGDASGTWGGWEDAPVDPHRLGDYLRDFQALLSRYGYDDVSLYGHFGQGCVHCRIPFDLVTPAGIAHFRAFLTDAAELVVRYGGSLSGEHEGSTRCSPVHDDW